MNSPVYLDSTVLSNFASTDSVDVILDVCPSPTVPAIVANEMLNGYVSGYPYLKNGLKYFHPRPTNWARITTDEEEQEINELHENTSECLPIKSLYDVPASYFSEGTERGIPQRFESLDPGEAGAPLLADHRNGTVATDDNDARDLAKSEGVVVTGSLGILANGVLDGAVNKRTADRWLGEWKKNGYHCPAWVNSVSDIIERTR